MLKARIYHPVFYRTLAGQLDRASARTDPSIIRIEADGRDGSRTWKVRDVLRPGETYNGRTFEDLARLIASGVSQVDL